MPKPPSDNNIQPENVSVEDGLSIDWDNIAIAVPHDMKTDIIVAARKQRLTPSEWGRAHLAVALAQEGFTDRRVSERRKAS